MLLMKQSWKMFLRTIYNLEIWHDAFKSAVQTCFINFESYKLLRDSGERESINKIIISIQDYRPELNAKDYFNEIIQFRKDVALTKES